MNTLGPDATNWYVVYPNGELCSDSDTNWHEISVQRDYGHETLSILSEPAASLTAIVAGRHYTLRAPDQDTHFFRFYRGRSSLSGGPSELIYHAIGYMTQHGRITLEIDPRGSCQCRFDPSTE